MMTGNYFVIACRSLKHNLLVASINILGLSIGIAAYFLLSQYASFELSYDRFHAHHENIYRIRHDTYKLGQFESSSAITYHALAPAIKETYPEARNYLRLHRADGMLNFSPTKGEVISHHIFDAFYADSSFFSVFSFPLIQGDPSKVLRNAHAMLISRSAAMRFFGAENPVGKRMDLATQWQGGSFIVEGVFEDIPTNTHLKFDYLFAIAGLLNNQQFRSHGWYWTNFYNYLVLDPGTDPIAFEKKIDAIADTYLGKDLRQRQAEENFVLQPLAGIHLNSNIGGEVQANGDEDSILSLLLISMLIVVIAWVNYVNLSTATAAKRAKEIGLRKVMGSTPFQIIQQFVIESFVVSALAVVMALLIILCTEDVFSGLLGTTTPLQLTEAYGICWFVLPTLIVGTLLSSFYPAVILSGLQPIAVLKGKLLKMNSGYAVRQVLTVVQFTAAIFLVISVFTIYSQIKFMRDVPLGITINHQLVIRSPRLLAEGSYLNKIDEFKRNLLASPLIRHVTTTSEVPGKEIFWTNEFREIHEDESVRHWMNIMVVDEDFLDTYDVPIQAGRNFSRQFVGDYGNVAIINMTALKRFGFKDPESAIGREIIATDYRAKKIIGVIDDFHQQSLKQVITPLILYFIPWSNDFYTVSIGADLPKAVIQIESDFKKTFPNNAFEYYFLDNQFNQQYRSEDRLSTLIMIFSCIAMLVACLGLFGLSSFMAIQKKKEVAIRKILGASLNNILTWLVQDYVKLMVISVLISSVLGWYFMNEWIKQFAYRIDISPIFFLVAGGICLIIGLFTIAANVIRSASTNPIDSMRSE